jgi:sugar phosphate isomerase/epimerase
MGNFEEVKIMQVFFSTGSFIQGEIEGLLDECQKAGLKNIELGSSVLYSKNIVDTILERRNSFNFIVHNYFPPPISSFVLNLASTDQEIHRKSVELCRHAIDLCVEVKSPFYSVHSGFAFHLNPTMLGNPVAQSRIDPKALIPREKAYTQFGETVAELSNYAKQRNVQLLVENNVSPRELLRFGEKSPFLLSDPHEILEFLKEMNDTNIGLLLDVGHAKVSSNACEKEPDTFFRILDPYIRALHLSDNDGLRDSNMPFFNQSWFAPYIKDLGSIPMIIEVYRISTETMKNQQRLLEDMGR